MHYVVAMGDDAAHLGPATVIPSADRFARDEDVASLTALADGTLVACFQSAPRRNSVEAGCSFAPPGQPFGRCACPCAHRGARGMQTAAATLGTGGVLVLSSALSSRRTRTIRVLRMAPDGRAPRGKRSPPPTLTLARILLRRRTARSRVSGRRPGAASSPLCRPAPTSSVHRSSSRRETAGAPPISSADDTCSWPSIGSIRARTRPAPRHRSSCSPSPVRRSARRSASAFRQPRVHHRLGCACSGTAPSSRRPPPSTRTIRTATRPRSPSSAPDR